MNEMPHWHRAPTHPLVEHYVWLETNTEGDKWLLCRRREKKIVSSFVDSFGRRSPQTTFVHHSNYHLFLFFESSSILKEADYTVWSLLLIRWCHRFRWQTIALMFNELFVVNFIFIRCFGSALITAAAAAAATVLDAHSGLQDVVQTWAHGLCICGCHRTYKSELNFIQLSLPVERARHSGVL